ncbi:glycosyltransferase family 4 protein, partial [Vibrio anguillarum]
VVWMIHSCDYFVVLSEGWSEYILSISNVKPIVIHNYVDISPNDINREKNTILFLGAFIKRKGIYELLRACSMLPLDFHLHLCGSGEDARVEDMVTELDLKERITFHGWVGNEDKKKLLASCSVMVLPAFNEGLPMTIIESMACEIPVLTTPVGAIPELIVDSISGYLVEPGEVSELASKLEFILSSPQELQDVVKTAKNIYTENFTSLQVLPKWKDIYDQASIR